MDPLFVDLGLVILIALLIIGGYRQGFVRAAGSFLGLVISLAIGVWGVGWLSRVTGINLTGNPVIFLFAFLTLSVIISQLLGLIVSALDMVRRLLSVIPFVSLLNSLFGALVGGAQAVAIIFALSFLMSTYAPIGSVRSTFLEAEIVSAASSIIDKLGFFGDFSYSDVE